MSQDELRALRERVAELEQQLKAAENTIKRAKNPDPVERPTLKRVLKLVRDACMTLVRTASGWVLSLGNKQRKFRRLFDIWELLLVDDWLLSEIFPESEQPRPRSRKAAQPRLPHRNEAIAPSYQVAWWQGRVYQKAYG
ncbi:hypothetical protein Glo7428_3767 [Gloeocapsa sp. PCC 7428]|uniref:hypothetical protein n=1 Tax=Gloeocapsa sp. PCC 7428 TaxID=1173026 RepID=UPI0002A5DE65|nr:hypothetical protein [Gloeocapsa sp. PCC 7428]AFZ32227.1 hypothetical protein Glo7428_3767 [Gloeocapsa sp. PCC 7428]